MAYSTRMQSKMIQWHRILILTTYLPQHVVVVVGIASLGLAKQERTMYV
jgi:hypothetical protein